MSAERQVQLYKSARSLKVKGCSELDMHTKLVEWYGAYIEESDIVDLIKAVMASK